ncbi:MAG: hypothetical protein ACTS1X_03785 [Parasphingopyxis sp.]|uniref:hypothetical protein n=1 Tax=Parasphingopyxis sp. TaxID=1920299 RepID=UPI003F9FC1BE
MVRRPVTDMRPHQTAAEILDRQGQLYLDHHLTLLRWIVTSLFLVNSGGGVASISRDQLTAWHIIAAGCFIAGAILSLWLGLSLARRWGAYTRAASAIAADREGPVLPPLALFRRIARRYQRAERNLVVWLASAALVCFIMGGVLLAVAMTVSGSTSTPADGTQSFEQAYARFPDQ